MHIDFALPVAHDLMAGYQAWKVRPQQRLQPGVSARTAALALACCCFGIWEARNIRCLGSMGITYFLRAMQQGCGRGHGGWKGVPLLLPPCWTVVLGVSRGTGAEGAIAYGWLKECAWGCGKG